MLNKLEFNNLMMAHKDQIRQARIQTINKLVHKLRRLKEGKKSKQLLPQHDNKLEEKFKKITEIIHQIKQLKGIDLVKNVLLLEKQPTAYITNALSTPSELSVAMLASNKIMASLINTFKLTLCLEDTINSNWKAELQDIGKRKRKLGNSTVKVKKRKHTATITKRRKSLDRHRSNPCKIMEDNANGSSTIIAEECEMNKIKSSDKINDHEVQKANESSNIEGVQKPKMNPFNKSYGKYKRQDNELGEDRESEESEETFVVDPFFVTESGNNYLSAVKQTTNECSENASENQKMHKTYSSNRQFPEGHRDHHNHRRHVNQTHNKNTKTDKIHPSWAAKQKTMIAHFKGKKITFDQADDIQNELNVKPNCQNKCDIVDNDNKNLHPSWAAKQKLRHTITAFQGKKIVFDNDDE